MPAKSNAIYVLDIREKASCIDGTGACQNLFLIPVHENLCSIIIDDNRNMMPLVGVTGILVAKGFLGIYVDDDPSIVLYGKADLPGVTYHQAKGGAIIVLVGGGKNRHIFPSSITSPPSVCGVPCGNCSSRHTIHYPYRRKEIHICRAVEIQSMRHFRISGAGNNGCLFTAH